MRPEVHHPDPPHDSHALEVTRAKTSKKKFGQKKDEFKDWNRPFVQMIIGRGLMNVLRDKWGVAMRERAQSLALSSSEKGDTHQQNRFETSVEDFHSVFRPDGAESEVCSWKVHCIELSEPDPLLSLTHQRGALKQVYSLHLGPSTRHTFGQGYSDIPIRGWGSSPLSLF